MKKVKILLLIIVIVIVAFIIYMYPFAKGVNEDAKSNKNVVTKTKDSVDQKSIIIDKDSLKTDH